MQVVLFEHQCVKKQRNDRRSFFLKHPTTISPMMINDQAVDYVQQYKYLGTVIDNKLTFELHVDVVCKTPQSVISACTFIVTFEV